jgi:hypothetical protein
MEFNRKMEIETQMQADRVEEERRKREEEEKVALVVGGKKTAAAAAVVVGKRMGTNGVVRKPNSAGRRRTGGF